MSHTGKMSNSRHEDTPIGLAVGLGAGLLTVALAVVADRSTLPPSPDTVVVVAQLVAGASFIVIGSLLWWRHDAPRIGLG